MAHAYFVTGDTEEGIGQALAFVEGELGLAIQASPNVMISRHGLLSVDDARRLRSLADLSPTVGDQKVIVISATRLFHEAQNALLKLFEEPPVGTTLILALPAEGMLLPTLRSRLVELPLTSARTQTEPFIEAREFLAASKAEREKIIAKIVDRSKSDKDDEKQAARLAAIRLVEGIIVSIYSVQPHSPAQVAFLDDLDAFLPILHERSAPLKLIFEHILLTIPQ